MGVGEQILEAVLRLEKKVDGLVAARAVADAPQVATDEQLDGKGGNPVVKLTIRKWVGPNFTNKKFSQCSPEFLDKYAETLTYLAKNPQAGKEKFVKYNLLDAARARGWAARLRAGWKPPGDEGYDQTDVNADDGYSDGPSYD